MFAVYIVRAASKLSQLTKKKKKDEEEEDRYIK